MLGHTHPRRTLQDNRRTAKVRQLKRTARSLLERMSQAAEDNATEEGDNDERPSAGATLKTPPARTLLRQRSSGHQEPKQKLNNNNHNTNSGEPPASFDQLFTMITAIMNTMSQLLMQLDIHAK